MVCLLMINTATGGAQGGVRLVVWYQPQNWSLESMRFHWLNSVSFEVVTDRNQNPIIGAYLPSSTLENLPDMKKAHTRFWDQYPIELGYLNANIGQAEDPNSHQVADLLMEFGLMDLLHYF